MAWEINRSVILRFVERIKSAAHHFNSVGVEPRSLGCSYNGINFFPSSTEVSDHFCGLGRTLCGGRGNHRLNIRRGRICRQPVLP